MPVPVSTKSFKSSEEKAELASNLIEDTKSIGNHQFIYSSLRHLLREEFIIDEVVLHANVVVMSVLPE